MKVPLFQIDAFSSEVFRGNPAAVCPLEKWLPDATMQAIAAENNLSETAFFVPEGDDFRLRWFTPTAEVDLCGHATLASAYAILTLLDAKRPSVQFHTRSGPLTVERRGGLLAMDFPSLPPDRADAPPDLVTGVGRPAETWKAKSWMAVFADEEAVRSLRPDIEAIRRLGPASVIVTAPGREADFVSRFFAPAWGVPEDPVTGSAHCTLIPYWSKRLDRTNLVARQVSARGGELFCTDRGDRVTIAGSCALYLEGTIEA